jgi:hypothetical protein
MEYAKSFADFMKREDDVAKTPIGRLRRKYLNMNPDVVFNKVGDIYCINGFLDSTESRAWSKFVMQTALELTDGTYDLRLHALDDISGGGHILLAEWFYYMAYTGCAYKTDLKLTRFQKEFRVKVLSKLSDKLGDFIMSLLEKEALCSYLLLRNSYMKYKDMFAPNKLLALKVINRFAKAHDIRFEDAESVLRGYTYCI